MNWSFSVSQPTNAQRALEKTLPLPAHRCRGLLSRGAVRRDGQIMRTSSAVTPGDRLMLSIEPSDFPAPILLFHGEDFLVAEKPQGFITCDDPRFTFIDLLALYGMDAAPCHRLDAGTGGVLLLALTNTAREAGEALFQGEGIEKHYRCICCGPAQAWGDHRAYLQKDAQRGVVRIYDAPRPGALPIRTAWHTIKSADALHLLDVRLYTGRTHQIRAHLAHLGLPVLGDDKYGDRAQNKLYRKRLPCLWASSLYIPANDAPGLKELSGKTFLSRPQFGPRLEELFPGLQDI